MAKKQKAELADAIFNSIENGDLEQLKNAIAAAQACKGQTWISKKLQRNSGSPAWSRQKRGHTTPIGLIIDMRWAEGLSLVEAWTNLEAPCDRSTRFSISFPAEKSAEACWAQGLEILVKRSSPSQKMSALMISCLKSNVECVRVLLEAGTPPTPVKMLKNRYLEGHSPFTGAITPLHAAVLAQSSSCVLELMAHGAEPSAFVEKGHLSPLTLGLRRTPPDWASLLPLLDWMLRTPRAPWQMDRDTECDEFMSIMKNSSHVASMLEFKKNGLDGEELLWKMAELHDVNARDVDGEGLVHWANRNDPNAATQKFNARVLQAIGWKGAIPETPRQELGDPHPDAAQQLRAASNEKLGASGTPEPMLDAFSQQQNACSENHPAKDPMSLAHMQEALDECLVAMGSMASAVAKLSACVSSQESAANHQGAMVSADALRREALSLMGKTRDVRNQMSRLAENSSPPMCGIIRPAGAADATKTSLATMEGAKNSSGPA